MISQAKSEQEDFTQRKASEQQAIGSQKGLLADAEASEKEMKSYLQEVGFFLILPRFFFVVFFFFFFLFFLMVSSFKLGPGHRELCQEGEGFQGR